MAKERLSKLHRYILKALFEKCALNNKGIKAIYLEKYNNSRKTLLNSDRVTLYKSIKNLLAKGFIERGAYRSYMLTEKGMETLKANTFHRVDNINFKDYKKRVDEDRAEYENLNKKYYKREATFSNKEIKKMWKRIEEYYNKYESWSGHWTLNNSSVRSSE